MPRKIEKMDLYKILRTTAISIMSREQGNE